MEINSPEAKKTVHDYDIVFDGGIGMQLTVDTNLGDTMSDNGLAIVVHQVSRPNLMDDKTPFPSRDITIFKSKVLSIQHIEREFLELTTEQKEDLRNMLLRQR